MSVPFQVDVRHDRAAAIVELAGELDGHAALQLDHELEQIWASDIELVIVDLRGVPFMDSTGLRSLVLAHRRAQREKRRFALVQGPERVRELLHWSGVLPILTVVADPAELLD